MVKTPLSGMSIKSMKASMKSPTGPKSIKSPLGQIFSPSTMHFANKKEEAEMMGNKDFRYNVLEPNGIVIAENHMSEGDWSRIAFSLGVPMNQEPKKNADVARFAYRMRKRKQVSDIQTVEALSSLLYTLSSPLALSQQETAEFYMDAVPCADEFKNSIHRVPKPTPSVSIGYKRGAFDHIDDELQRGIIANEQGYPVDLGRISQPARDHFWPFLVVEVAEHSIMAAKHACAVSASSCNNAVRLLAHAAKSDKGIASNPFSADTNTTQHCFSLAVCGKIASLNVHEPDAKGRHVLRTITTYSLDDDDEVAALTDRLRSIMVWGRYCRLEEICDKLEALNRKVNGGLPPNHMAHYQDDFDPAILKTLTVRLSKNKKKKAVMHASVPGWMRSGGILTA